MKIFSRLIVAFLISIFTSSLTFSQIVNVKTYGALGDGKTDDSQAFLKAIKDIKNKYSSKKEAAILFIPNGTYKISESIVLDKYISLEGEFINRTILQITSSNKPLINLEKNFNEDEIYHSYNYVKNITLFGPDYKNSPFSYKAIPNNTTNSIGIKIEGLRTRLENLQIEGFFNSGIEVSGSYYTFITNSFIKNNAIGLKIDKQSTSVYLTLSELRFNSIGIFITGNSFANFMNNNMIESNIGHFYTEDRSLNQNNINSTGRAIVIKNAISNIVNNNYFENHAVNITLDNAQKNIISNNFIAISDQISTSDKNQVSLQLIGRSEENIYEKNSFLTTTENLNANKIIVGTEDYSSNKIDVGKDNEKVKAYLKKNISLEKNRPVIP